METTNINKALTNLELNKYINLYINECIRKRKRTDDVNYIKSKRPRTDNLSELKTLFK